MNYLIVLYFLVVSALAKNCLASNVVKIDPNANWRVFGGENAPDGEYPYMVSLRGYNQRHVCGGAIVHEEWVLTAAHCVNGESPSDYKVVAGSNKLNKGGDFYQVLEIHFHELFNVNGTKQNDVAILKVEKINFTDKVNKIKLEKTFVDGGESVTITGWGATSLKELTPNDLQHLTYKTATVKKCKRRLLGQPLDDSQICTLHRAGIGGCYGDSGSPLIRSVDGVRYAVGIVSYGPQCGSGFFPDVFSRVSSFVSWFNKKCNCNL